MTCTRYASQDAERQKEIEDALRACPTLSGWPADCVRELAGSARLRRYRRSTQLAVRGSQRREIFVVVSGAIEVAAISDAGDKFILSVLEPGQIARLVQLLDDAPMLFACYAREDSTIVHVPAAAMKRILDAEPILWRGIAELALRRFHLGAEVQKNQVLGSVRRRLAVMLLMIARSFGDRDGGGYKAELRISQADLANLLGVSRQTINKELKRLKAERILGSSDGYCQISLLDTDGLRRVAGEG